MRAAFVSGEATVIEIDDPRTKIAVELPARHAASAALHGGIPHRAAALVGS
jgi:hypothetical protein